MIRANEYDVTSMKMPIYSATTALVKGQSLIWGVDAAATSTSCLITSASTGADIFAVLMETPATQATNVSTPLIYQAPVQIVQPVHIWKVYYDMTVSTALAVTSCPSSTTIETATHDTNLGGSWIYVNSGTGAGQLRYVTVDADSTHFTVSSAWATSPDSTSKIILIRCIGLPTGGHILNTTFDKLLAKYDGTNTTEIIVLKNFIEGPFGNLELDPTLNPILTTAAGLNTRGCRFYSLVVFSDTKISAKG